MFLLKDKIGALSQEIQTTGLDVKQLRVNQKVISWCIRNCVSAFDSFIKPLWRFQLPKSKQLS